MPATTLTRSPKMAPESALYRSGIAAVDDFTPNAAVGNITEVAQASHVDGESFVLIDTSDVEVTFWYDVTGTFTPVGGYDATNVRVDISGDTTADDVAVTVRAAVNGATIGITASGATDQVVLTQDTAGTDGNTTIAFDVADAGYIVVDFTGGTVGVPEAHSINMATYENAHITVIPTGGANPTVRVFYWNEHIGNGGGYAAQDVAVAGAGADTPYTFTVQCRSRKMFVAVTVLAAGAVAIAVSGSRLIDQPSA
jgi:hypothetical protein